VIFDLALSFRHLTFSDESDRLRIAFGAWPLFRRHVLYSEIVQVDQARSTIQQVFDLRIASDNIIAAIRVRSLAAGTFGLANLTGACQNPCQTLRLPETHNRKSLASH